ncbi:flagellar biosynthesis protein FlhB [Conexibacter sp. DBS9H8]|uniref:flagellar biosynthesis protein FlhB n=1 Tax=Conexibacter sp. DBS9H8 TaxID=2937801 RepID=UPI00200FAB28|nr:flagellar biosynthesis protein FlhB [Conexibacter sp. DBS9H8]
MANDDKTEKPTAKHRREARAKGQVAKSTDLSGAVVVSAGLIAVLAFSGAIAHSTGAAMVAIFGQIARPANVMTGAGLHGLMSLLASTVIGAVAPIAGVCLAAAVIVNVAQAGLKYSPKALKPTFSKLNPLTNAKRIFGPRAGFETAKSIAKVAVVGSLIALTLVPDMTHIQASVGTGPGALAVMLRTNLTGLALRAGAGYLLIGVIDYAWQRRQVEKSLKMTKQEVRDEFKAHDLPAEVKSAIRRRQLQAARARMMAAVPRADVVVTNPTHFAVALQYSGDVPAPVVVAKGQDNVALSIRRIANEHAIPIVENKPLARELFRVVEVDQMIPADLYAAVAEVLAFVYRMAARRKVAV